MTHLRPPRFFGPLALAGAVFAYTHEARAQTGLPDQPCVVSAAGNVNCTANDLRVGSARIANGAVLTCEPGSTVLADVEFTIESGPDRYDIGLWVNQVGGDARTDPGNVCYRDILSPAGTCNYNASPPTYHNGDNDACGDVPSVGTAAATCPGAVIANCTGSGGTCLFTTRTVQVEILCVDDNSDGVVDTGTCTSYDNQANANCNGTAQAIPSNASKCNCGRVTIGNLLVDPCDGVQCDSQDTLCADYECVEGACVPTVINEGGTCGEASTCFSAPTCQTGTCTPNPSPVGSACGDTADTTCTDPDTCDGAGNCLPRNAVDGTLCGDTGTACTNQDTCVGGVCADAGFQPQGTTCDDDNGCTVGDACDGAGACTPGAECPAGGTCDPETETCVGCVDDQPVGGVDEGCETIINACDVATGGGTCVDCLADGDCSVAGEVCDIPDRECVPCVDTGPGVLDKGCEDATLNACKNGGTDTGTCVDCTVDADCDNQVCNTTTNTCIECLVEADCPSGETCDTQSNTCVECITSADCSGGEVCDPVSDLCEPCVDDASYPAIDSGCETELPVCVDQGSIAGGGGVTIRTCVVCADTASANAVDEGCGGTTPICDVNVPGGRCVECDDNTDCSQGEVCNLTAGICVACLDDRTAGTVDSGCTTDLPVCEVGVAGPDDDHCVACEDDKPTGQTDWGCDALAPNCDVNAEAGPTCVECFDNTDCDPGEICAEGACVSQDATVAVDDAYATNIDTTLTISDPDLGVLANDFYPAGSTVSVTITQGTAPDPSEGTLTLEADGTFTFVPAQGFVGRVEFSYTLTNTTNGSSSVGDVVIVVNGPPFAVDDFVVTDEGVTVTVDVLANDSDPNGDPLTLTRIVTEPVNGSAVIGSIIYTPTAGFFGDDELVYEVCDPSGLCDTATVFFTVNQVNTAPVATPDSATTAEDTLVVIDVTENDSDADGDPLTVTRIVTPADDGATRILPDGSVEYVPGQDFNGEDSFVYEVCDERGVCDEAEVTVTVTPVDDAPVAADDASSTTVGTAIGIPVLANDSDVDGDPLTVTRIVSDPSSGTAVVGADGVVTYTPGEIAGTFTFTYEVCDPSDLCDTATVSVTVTGANTPPIAVGETVLTPEDTAVYIVVLANDSDPDGDAISVTGVTVPPRHGTTTIDANGGVLYTPALDYHGPDVFTYQICDARGACDTAVVSITVGSVNDAPRANDDFYAVPAQSGVVLDVILNDSDPELDPIAVSRIVTQPRFGQAFVNPDGTVTYEGTATGGSDFFDYEVCDDNGGCDTARVTVFVGTDNDNPTPADDDATTPTGEAVTIDVLANDSDPDGDTLTITQVEDPAHGSAVIQDGEIVYTSDLDYVGTDIFFYTVCDPGGACATAFVVVDVTPADNVPPVAVDDTVQTPESTPVTFDATENDFDFDGDILVVIEVGDPPNGSAVINPDGTVTYTPDEGFTGEDTFTVTISDQQGGTSTSTVLVVVVPADNLPPDAVDDDYGDVPGDAVSILPVLENDSDPEDDPLIIVDVVQPQHGTATIAEDNSLIYTPNPGYFGPDQFSYTITDDQGGYDTAFVFVYVGDRDRDGLGDGWEVTVTFTDPDNPDTDGDQLKDGEEVGGGDDPFRYEPGVETNPLDADTDDDGINDGDELRGTGPLTDYAPTDPLNPDSDGDGVGDGVEVSVTEPVPGGESNGVPFTGTNTEIWIPDADPETSTDPLDDDSDDDGLLDGNEDENGNGRWDGEIGGTGTPGTGETDASNPDTDGDGIQDGTELGLTEPQGTGTDLALFKPDLDPTTTTDPRDTDSDDGGVPDGAEDLNFNGYQDPGEIDPNIGQDDTQVADAFVAEGGGCAGGAAGAMLFGVFAIGLVALRRRRARP